MAKATCKNHKRFVPTCDPCKSAALKETVGFPGGRAEAELPGDVPIEPGDVTIHPEPQQGPQSTSGPFADEAVNDIPDYEPDEPEGETVSGYGIGGGSSEGEVQPPDDPDAPLAEGAPGPDFDAARDKAESEFDAGEVTFPSVTSADEEEADHEPPPGQISDAEAAGYPDEPKEPILTPGEGEPEYSPEEDAEADRRATQMSPLEMATFMFPARLMSQTIEPFIQKTLAAYITRGLTPEDAVIVTAAKVVEAEQLGATEVVGGAIEYALGNDAETLTPEEVEEAFDAGVEAAPEITGCIEDYNQGFNEGLVALRTVLRTYYAGDEDAPAYSLGLWLDEQVKELRK